MRAWLSALVLGVVLSACGSSGVTPDPGNAAGCPPTYQNAVGASCGAQALTCGYTGVSRPCGAGSSDKYTIDCPGSADGGVAMWSLVPCI
jgi:hypothetical protein